MTGRVRPLAVFNGKVRGQDWLKALTVAYLPRTAGLEEFSRVSCWQSCTPAARGERRRERSCVLACASAPADKPTMHFTLKTSGPARV